MSKSRKTHSAEAKYLHIFTPDYLAHKTQCLVDTYLSFLPIKSNYVLANAASLRYHS